MTDTYNPPDGNPSSESPANNSSGAGDTGSYRVQGAGTPISCERPKPPGSTFKNIAAALMLGGGGIIVLGAVVMLIPGWERVVAVIASAGSLIALTGIAVGFLGRAPKNTTMALRCAGAGIMVLGAAIMLAVPSRERVGVAVAGMGFLVAAGGLALGFSSVPGIRRPASKPFRWFLWLLACAFLLMMLGTVVVGGLNLYYCSQFSRSLGISMMELIYHSLTGGTGIVQQHPGIYAEAQDRCFFGFVELTFAAACTFSFLAVLRYLNMPQSRNE
jgi:hypothetical protein